MNGKFQTAHPAPGTAGIGAGSAIIVHKERLGKAENRNGCPVAGRARSVAVEVLPRSD